MIRKLRCRFILITMACIGFLFALILCVINVSMTLSSRAQGYALLHRIAGDIRPEDGKGGRLPNEAAASFPDKKRKHPGEPVGGFDAFRSFSVLYDQNKNILDMDFQENSGFTEEEIKELASRVMDNPKEKGVLSRYLYITKEENGKTRIYFLDYSVEKSLFLRLFRICLLIGLPGILFLFIVVLFLSRWVVLPVQTAFDRQKQFIADASHELKTPLTIITANAEVLAGSLGENRWLNHILAQTGRMNLLIKDLLALAKLDTGREALKFAEFDMSTTVKNAALSFESLAYEYGKKFEMEIAEHILLNGNENAVRQLTTLLLDNAFKYSEDGGRISLSLTQSGEKRILTVENTGKGIAGKDQARIFERFYRSDTSRSRDSGGYGLGLSIAASVAEAHGGQIQVKSDERSYTRFTVIFPQTRQSPEAGRRSRRHQDRMKEKH